ncbi:hypothetical protein M8818_002393 [Zalaria obscura]|uniref:Uncharacterized protein n=1 Tax=Zalaria obscura TaxID=2024903 RepID=A0ACC3SHN0_9PEZI
MLINHVDDFAIVTESCEFLLDQGQYNALTTLLDNAVAHEWDAWEGHTLALYHALGQIYRRGEITKAVMLVEAFHGTTRLLAKRQSRNIKIGFSIYLSLGSTGKQSTSSLMFCDLMN